MKNGTDTELIPDTEITGQTPTETTTPTTEETNYGACDAPGILLTAEDGGQIFSADLDGGNFQLVTSDLDEPKGVDFDPDDCWVYYAAEAEGVIGRVRPDGTSNTVLIADLEPTAIELDLVDEKIYWVDDDASVNRANLNGSDIVQLVPPEGNSSGMALDLVGGKIFWGNWLGLRIQKANLDGSGVETVLMDAGVVEEIDVDTTKGCVIYWAVENLAEIRRVDCDGTNAQVLLDSADGLVSPEGLALDLVEGKIYFSDEGTDAVMRAELDGSLVETVIDVSLSGPSGLVVID